MLMQCSWQNFTCYSSFGRFFAFKPYGGFISAAFQEVELKRLYHSEAAAGKISLPPGAVHLWWLNTERIQLEAKEIEYLNMLPKNEKLNLENCTSKSAFKERLLSRCLARFVLQRYIPSHMNGKEIELIRAHGKPKIDTKAHSLPYQFSVSHTSDIIGIAITNLNDIGLDIEINQRPTRYASLQLAKRYFSESEITSLKELRGKKQQEQFIRIWTLKEAYLKAIGTGINGSVGLKNFSFEIHNTIYEFYSESSEQDIMSDMSFETAVTDFKSQYTQIINGRPLYVAKEVKVAGSLSYLTSKYIPYTINFSSNMCHQQIQYCALLSLENTYTVAICLLKDYKSTTPPYLPNIVTFKLSSLEDMFGCMTSDVIGFGSYCFGGPLSQSQK